MRAELWLSILAQNGRGPAFGSLYRKLPHAVPPPPPHPRLFPQPTPLFLLPPIPVPAVPPNRPRQCACAEARGPEQAVPADVKEAIFKDVSRSFPTHELCAASYPMLMFGPITSEIIIFD